MSYKLFKLAPGSYDLALNGVIIGSVVQDPENPGIWSAELLIDPEPQNRPPPFTQLVHEFGSFEELRRWLGTPELKSSP